VRADLEKEKKQVEGKLRPRALILLIDFTEILS
jgi:hypothetical protein